MSISWSQALAWRMRRHLLEPIGSQSAAGVVRRLGAVLAMDESLAELAIRARRTRSRSGELAQALAEGRVIKTFAFRGATHYLSPEDGGAYLALRAASRMWELPSWQEYYELKPADWPAFSGDGPRVARRRAVDPARARSGGHGSAEVPALAPSLRRRRRHTDQTPHLAG